MEGTLLTSGDLRQQLQYAAIACVFFLAFWRGAGPERGCAVVLVGMILSDRLYHAITDAPGWLGTVDLAHAAIDIGCCAAFIAIALRANRRYCLWMAGFQIVAVLSHVARGMAEQISPIVYSIMQVAPSYFQIVILALGIFLHHRRASRHGSYRSWRSSSPPSRARMPRG